MKTAKFTDAIALLKAGHRDVEDLFAPYEGTNDRKKRKLADSICNSLKIYAVIKAELFYPALEGKVEGGLLNEAYVEHDGAKLLINDITATPGIDEIVDAKVKVRSEEIKHGVGEEEMRVVQVQAV